MLDIIMFGAIALMLMIVIGLLVVILKEHRHGDKSFDLYLKQSQRELREDEEKRVAEPKNFPTEKMPQEIERSETARQESRERRGPRRIEPLVQTDKSEETPSGNRDVSSATTSPVIKLAEPCEIEENVSSEMERKLIEEIEKRGYGSFSHARLVEGMGLSPEEADEFVIELIHQLEDAVNQIEESMKENAFEEIEHITHGVKGAALNIGNGGVAELLVDFNTYMKSGRDPQIVRAYLNRLKQAISDLKVEYSQVA
ncbi:Hpt domain-containing protein [Hydrogenimonas cancrithermarum]|uniref:HPt domain-containing protein n=1 Tax=Hydrogenimonas cancrithermarum TaxID=2993563 RepID=A0ABN6WZI8_9BACT|nr:Hpt domain-containing protein [Hydrogenimonas cancrithermarum]BDY13859.1 hypothetical protein HCR_21710 [Hydrogenimonas cancrithermarum]